MTFKRRLILLVCLLSAAIVALTAISGWLIYRTDLEAARIYHHRVVTMHRLTVISDLYADDIIRATTRLAAGRASRATSLAQIRDARDVAAQLWQDYRQQPLAGTEILLSQEIEAALGDIDLRIDALAVAADDGAMRSVIGTEIEPYIDRLSAQFANLADQQLLIAERDYQAAHRAFAWGLAGVLAAAVGAIFGMAYITLIIIRRVTNPLRQALALSANPQPGATANHGDLDEIGAVIETLRQVRSNLRDATTQQAEQERLAKSFRAQLEAIFRHAPIGVYMKDVDGRMLVVSEAAAQLWGHDHDELIGKPDTSWSSPREAAIIAETNQQVLETGGPIRVEYRGEAPNTYDWLLSVKFPVRDEAGTIIMIGGFDLDISDLKNREEDLRTAATHLQTVKRLAKMFYWSRRFDQRSGDEAAYDMDRELEILTGRDDISKDNATYAQQVIHPDDRAATLATYMAFERREIDRYQVEYRLLCANGSYLPVRAWVERSRDPVTQDDLVAGVIQDISTEKQRERQLLAATAEAEASNRAKSEFLANMSHELRTPLNAVIGFSDLLKLNDTVQRDQRLTTYVDAVNDSGRSLLEIINAILDMARLDSAERTLHERRFPLADVLAEVARQMAPRAREKGVQLHFPMILPAPDDSVPAPDVDINLDAEAGHLDRRLMIQAEDHALRQILGNVIANAIKFTASGGSVTLTTRIDAGGDLAITIADTGSGIDAKLIPLLALPFTQAGSAWTRRKGGIGLGLAIARKLLELHQGRLEIDSQPGQGTRMTLIFPAARLASPDAAAARTQQTQR